MVINNPSTSNGLWSNTNPTRQSSTNQSPARNIRGVENLITEPTPIVTCPFRNGFQRINVEAFMGEQQLQDRPLAVRCMISAWASMLNLGRKGEAKAIWEMGTKAFGEGIWESTVEQCLKGSKPDGEQESLEEGGVPVSEK